MAAVFAAASEAPITAIMIVFEMSDDYTIILPLMVAVVIATLLGRRLLGYTIYERKLLRRGIDWQRIRNPQVFARISVAQVGRTPPFVAQSNQTIRSLALEETPSMELTLPVCEGNRFVGVVNLSDVSHALANGKGERSIETIMLPAQEVLAPTDTLERAATLMADPRAPLLPVIANDVLVGVVTRRDLLSAYRSVVSV
jgi:CIC family chloride channel protein